MREWPEESIDFMMFSPPYWGLRNYGESTEIDWGDWKGQLGLEPTWQMYVAHMVTVCRELKRVLKKIGSMYIVLGDTYAGSGQGHKISEQRETYKKYSKNLNFPFERPTVKIADYQPKCLMGIPWRVAFALIDDGWVLRERIVWHKGNPMPGSQKDRLTQTCETIFHFVKNSGKALLWRNELTGEWISLRPRQVYFHVETHELKDKCPSKEERYAVDEFGNRHLVWKPLWRGFDYYYELDAIREPHETSSLKRAGKTGIVPFNLRVRDAKRGKKGVFVEAGKVKQLKASQEEVETYNYPEKAYPPHEPRHFQLLQMGIPHGGHTGKTVRHDHPLGKNPGDVFRSNSKFLKSDVKTASPGGRGIRAIKEGKLTTFVRKRILDVGAYLKQKLKESGYKTEELAEIIKIKKTTIDHYFRTDFTGQALPDRHTWKLLKPLLNLGEYEDFIDEEIRSALPQPHPLGKNPGDVVSTKHDLAVNRVGNFSYTDPLHVKAYNTKGKNPGDVIKYNSKYEKSDYGQTLQAFTREQTILKARKQSRIDAKRLFPNDLQKQQEYINYIHDHDGHPKGKNPGDIIKTKNAQEAFLGHPPTNYYRMGEAEKGKNPGDFWSVNTKPFKGAHFAVYCEEICVKPILSSCPPDGVVLDPMAGSGTTCVVAKKLGKKYIGIELNSEYVTIAKKRLSKIPEKLSSFSTVKRMKS